MLFSPEDLAALTVPGIAERWAAVQAQLHPRLAALAAQLDAAASAALPRIWPLYEVSWKTARMLNRGRGRQAPITEYHFALDRVPRGAGIYVGVSGEEQAILVGLTVTGRRKIELGRVWEAARPVWATLAAALPEVRFAGADRPPPERWWTSFWPAARPSMSGPALSTAGTTRRSRRLTLPRRWSMMCCSSCRC